VVAVPDLLRSSLVDLPHQPRLQKAYVAAVDTAPEEIPPWAEEGADNIAFQYWPESLTDSRGSEWNPRTIPGGSHPIYQWTHGGERRISFVAMFTTDTEPPETALRRDNPYSPAFDTPGALNLGTRDMDIRAAISWLRWFTYPTYGQGEDLRVFEPAKVLLCLPNTGLAHTGEDHITCVMTNCEVTYEAWFTNGFPRLAEVSIEVAEVVQRGNRIRFHDRKDMSPSAHIGAFTGVSDDGGGSH
jgi:hypothetical protein